MGEMIGIEALHGEGRFAAYRARPEGDPRTAIVLVQEIFGLNPNMRRAADLWAEQGYLVIAPDMFWRLQPGVQLDPTMLEQREEAIELKRRFDVDAGVRDLEATIRWARNEVGSGGVGVIGYCFGGLLAFLAATRTDADVSVGYYGGGIDERLSETHAIARPLMLHFGETDDHIPLAAVDKVRGALAGHSAVTIHTYPGAGHGFASTIGPHRHDEAAREADARTAALLADALG